MCIVTPSFQGIFRRCDTCRLGTRFFSENLKISKDLVHLGEGGVEVDPVACMRRSI